MGTLLRSNSLLQAIHEALHEYFKNCHCVSIDYNNNSFIVEEYTRDKQKICKYLVTTIDSDRLLLVYRINKSTFAYKGKLLEVEVIGEQVSTLEYTGSIEELKIKKADVEYVFTNSSVDLWGNEIRE